MAVRVRKYRLAACALTVVRMSGTVRFRCCVSAGDPILPKDRSLRTSRGGSLFGGFLGGLEWGVSMVAGAALGAWLGLQWGHRTMGSK